MFLVKCCKVLGLLLFAAIVLAEVPEPVLLELESGYVREMPPGQKIAAAYMTLSNTTNNPIEVVALKTADARQAELHETLQVDGLMRMNKLDRLRIPPGERVNLQQGGVHVMLLDVERRLLTGHQVAITLYLGNGEEQQISLPVKRDSGVHNHH